jgi:hypothetical protein
MSNIKKQSQNPDSFSYTSYSGKKETQEFKLFDSELIRHNVQEWLVVHNATRMALDCLPEKNKFKFYRETLFIAEKMICNWTYVQEEFPSTRFDITEIPEYQDYNPVLSEQVLIRTNQMTDYDKLGITWKQALLYIDEYLLDNFPKKTDIIEIQKELTQDQVSALLDKCLSDSSYVPSPQENSYAGSSKYPVYSTRWVERKIKEHNKSKDELFNHFELLLMNNPQPTYKLCSFINPQLHLKPSSTNFQAKDDKARGKALSVGIHKLVLDKFKNLFLDWYRKKYLGETTIEIHIFDGQEVFVTDKTRVNVTPTKVS